MENNLYFACGITLYNPSEQNIANVINYIEAFDIVFVYDNSDKQCLATSKLKHNNQIIYLGGSGNQGLPHAYNTMLQSKEIKNIDFLCTLDQDSIFTKTEIIAMKEYIKGHDMSDIGIIAPYINYTDKSYVHSDCIVEKKWTITSGAFLNLSLMRKEHLYYDELYFIDKFDIDICETLIQLKYKIVIYLGAELKQQLGEASGYTHPNHNPLRHRYIFRNRFYYNHKFYNRPIRWVLNALQSSKHIFLILMYEENKIEKVKMFFLACNDYYHGRMGEIKVKC